METLFWKDRWIDGRTPSFLWPEKFSRTPWQNGTVWEMSFLFDQAPFSTDEGFLLAIERLWETNGESVDKKWWLLSGNSKFSVKSFYCFLVDGGCRWLLTKVVWSKPCPKKINIFNWLAWNNKILTLDNLVNRRCNRLPTATCVLCRSTIESVDHLFVLCPVASQVWAFFVRLLHLLDLTRSLQALWSTWRLSLRPTLLVVETLVPKAIVWNIWLARNDYIFNNITLPVHALLLKIDHMLLS